MKQCSGYMIAVLMVVSILTLMGWAFSIHPLLYPVGGIAMNPITALCFLLTGISFILDYKIEFTSRRSAISASIAVMVAAIGVLKLLMVFGIDLHVDQWLFRDAVIADRVHGGVNRISPNTALNFVLMGLALRFGVLSSSRTRMVCSYIALTVSAVGLIALIGHIYHVREHHGVPGFATMSVQSAVCFISLSVAYLLENLPSLNARYSRQYIKGMHATKSGV